MSVFMAAFGYELLAALQELLEQFDEGSGDDERTATISSAHHAELVALIERASSE
jgi:hypothetical protein